MAFSILTSTFDDLTAQSTGTYCITDEGRSQNLHFVQCSGHSNSTSSRPARLAHLQIGSWLHLAEPAMVLSFVWDHWTRPLDAPRRGEVSPTPNDIPLFDHTVSENPQKKGPKSDWKWFICAAKWKWQMPEQAMFLAKDLIILGQERLIRKYKQISIFIHESGKTFDGQRAQNSRKTRTEKQSDTSDLKPVENFGHCTTSTPATIDTPITTATTQTRLSFLTPKNTF